MSTAVSVVLFILFLPLIFLMARLNFVMFKFMVEAPFRLLAWLFRRGRPGPV